MAARFSASAVSSPAAASACAALDRVAQIVGLAPRLLDRARCAATASSAARRALHSARDRRGIVLQARIGVEQRRCAAMSTSARSSCWPWISTSAAPSALQHLHAHRLVVDEGAGAPVGELHAAQIRPSSVAMPFSAISASGPMATFRPRRRRDLALFGAVRAPGWHHRGCRARAQKASSRIGTCRRGLAVSTDSPAA
jgi:hypothetical protein